MRLKSPKFLAGLVVVGGLTIWGSMWAVAEAPRLPFVYEHKTVSVLFAGDIMLDRNVAVWREADPTPMFLGVEDVFKGVDYRVANLEGNITDEASIARRNSSILRFTFNPAFAKTALSPLDLSAVSQANNHAWDFGSEGYAATQAYLSQWGIQYFGHPYNATSSLSTVLHTKLGDVCLVGYMGVWGGSPNNTLRRIQALRPDCWRIVVFAHWGVEYESEASAVQIAEAHSFVDAGADVVIGAHPHVVEPHEVYKGKVIFYSLGNFMFDQEFSPDVMKGLMVRVQFGQGKDCFTPIPVSITHASVGTGEPLDTFCLP